MPLQRNKDLTSQERMLESNEMATKVGKPSSVASKAKKLYWSVAIAASSIPFIPACTKEDTGTIGWWIVGGLFGSMLTATGIHAIINRIKDSKKENKEKPVLKAEEPATNWSREID